MTFKKSLYITVFLIPMFSKLCFCQDNKGFFTGGSFGLQFGTITLIDVQPIFGYKFNKHLAAGIGGTYKHYRYKNYYYIHGDYYDLKSKIYGGSIFSRYYLSSENVDFFNNLFIHAEYELVQFHYKTYYIDNLDVKSANKTKNIGSILAGLGYRQLIGRNAYMNIMVLWNLNETVYSPYSNPVIEAGFDIGL
jgi:hypothetical protein